jgi:hypothetical protein
MSQGDEKRFAGEGSQIAVSARIVLEAHEAALTQHLLAVAPAHCCVGEAERPGVRGDQSRSEEFTPVSYKNQDYSINIDWL